MRPDQKKARFEQVAANRALRRDTLSKDSIAMENPAYKATERSTNFSPSAINTSQRNHETTAESAPPEGSPMKEQVTSHVQPLHQEVMKEGNILLQT